MTMQIHSSAFENGAMIPAKFTCDGENISPPLEWFPAPLGVKSYVLISDDPDAPAGTWVHWVLFNIPANVTAFPEKMPPVPVLPDGSLHGITDFGQLGYGGPCPPSGTHRYFFKIYALNTKLDLKPGATKREVEKAMQGHILAQGELMGNYKRSR
ncbi:MAG: YbhB/YbcL family Raf kinase inhibitor-like protein [Candidatus Omnitrophica bacterium]|nr:YbhB/YbcL family Raf kinase inhibitor-like protein [Candidatus Omnitrophota bacterium]MDD5671410.1 YbhB/YbcL family Raf kinase inhibitor-like protein [Candidatus Omnitrophota bacterium]